MSLFSRKSLDRPYFSAFVRTPSFAAALALALLAEATIVLEFVLLFDAFATLDAFEASL